MTRWRTLLDTHPDLRTALDELVQDTPGLTAARPLLGLAEPARPAPTGWVPFTSEEIAAARRAGWDD